MEDVLDVFLRDLSGELPYMSKTEKEKYKVLSEDVNIKYNEVISCFLDQEEDDYVVPKIKEYVDSVIAQNSLLNDLYYKAGIRLGFSLKDDLQANMKKYSQS